ncbi:MAG TPA: matrixin family metalloprotease [Polyangiaceae bacterium]|nr:matrixin family metalloprotease [Polyangiaceae bacterium]
MARAERCRAAAAVLALSFLLAHDARAYCVATTCDQKTETCGPPVNGCIVVGARLHWESRCLSFGVQRNGSPLRHITYATADAIIQTAFEQWLDADCGAGARPSFNMWDLGKPFGGIVCDEPEFNSTKPNANVWMFRDDKWPYEGADSTLALTSTIFEKSSGALLDADVEINSIDNVITTTSISSQVQRDLQAIVTHEAGHFLGLGHSQDPKATMYAEYSPGDLNYRSLTADDQAGICSVYPPNRDAPACTAPSPAHGFSLYCGGGDDDGTASVSGCTMPSRGGASAAGGLLVVAALGSAALGRRRKRTPRRRFSAPP